MSDKQIVTIAGGGSGYTPGIVLTILNHKEFEVKEIRLYDDDPIKNEKMEIKMAFCFFGSSAYDNCSSVCSEGICGGGGGTETI